MMRIALAVMAIFVAVAVAVPARAALPAYIDLSSGIIVGRGEADLPEGASRSAAREDAISIAKKNIRRILGRQPVDPKSMEQRTVEQYLDSHPGKQGILDSFIDTARISNETEENGKFKVTISLPVDGPDGFKLMLARLMGRVITPANTSAPQVTPPVAVIDKELMDRLQETSGAVGPLRLAILKFENNTDYDTQDIGGIFTERLLEKFRRERRFVFPDESEIKRILAARGVTAKELLAAEAGKPLRMNGLDGLVAGAVTRYEPEVVKKGIGSTGYLETNMHVEVDLRVLDGNTGRWEHVDTVKITVSERAFTLKAAEDANRFIQIDDLDSKDGLAARAFAAAFKKVDGIIRTIFPLEGYVLKVIGERAYLNLTRADGLHIGDTLTVYRIGDILSDPVTGEKVGRIRDRIGSLRVTEVAETYSQAISAETPSAPINAGDVVVVHYEQNP